MSTARDQPCVAVDVNLVDGNAGISACHGGVSVVDGCIRTGADQRRAGLNMIPAAQPACDPGSAERLPSVPVGSANPWKSESLPWRMLPYTSLNAITGFVNSFWSCTTPHVL